MEDAGQRLSVASLVGGQPRSCSFASPSQLKPGNQKPVSRAVPRGRGGGGSEEGGAEEETGKRQAGRSSDSPPSQASPLPLRGGN